MKIKKSTVINILFILFAVELFFNPLGLGLRTKLMRITAFAPRVEKEIKALTPIDWQLRNEEGQIVKFADLKGKPIILNFWATWCPPCIAEKKSFQKLYDDYKDKVNFLFVTQDEPQKVIDFKKENGYTLPVYFSSITPKEFEHSRIPRTFLLSPKGEIVIDKSGIADWNSDRVRELLDSMQ